MKLKHNNTVAKIVSGIIFIVLSSLLFINLQETSVTITVNGQERAVLSEAMTVGELLEEQGITVKDSDILFPHKNAEVTANMNIVFTRTLFIQLQDGNEKHSIWTAATTVDELLQEGKIELNQWDEITPSLETVLQDNQEISITRIEKEEVTEEEEITYNVKETKDATLTVGKKKVVQKGQTGLKKKHYEVTYANGVQIDKTLLKEEVVIEKVDHIIAVGTKPKPKPQTKAVTTFNNSNSNVVAEFYVEATAYTALCDTGCTGITRTGINLLENPTMKVIAVDPKVIPLGTRVYVEGYGYAIAGDTGGAIKGYKIDVFINSLSEARKWGRKKVLIKILK